MKYQFSSFVETSQPMDLERSTIIFEIFSDAIFLAKSWNMAELPWPKMVFGLVDKNLDDVSSDSGSYQGVLCYNFLTFIADSLYRYGIKRLSMISQEKNKPIINTMGIVHPVMYMRQAIKDNDYCLPGGYCRQFTSCVEYCIKKYNKMTGNEFDFYRIGDEEEEADELPPQ